MPARRARRAPISTAPSVRGDTDLDVTILKVDLAVPAGVNCLSFNFRFGSEEYPEFKGTAYNDAFIAELDTSTWTTGGSSIFAADNFAFDPTGKAISINAAGFTSMTEANAAGTIYDGATPLLSASTPVAPGAHSVFFSIFDQADRALDSAVLLDRLRLSTVAAGTCTQGATILTAAKTADAPSSQGGGANGYTITIANTDAESFEIDALVDDLPDGFTYTPGSTTGVTTADPTVTGQRLRWAGPLTIPAAGTLTLHLGVTVADEPGTYLNEASAESADVSITPTGPTAPIVVTPALSVGDVTVTEGDAGTKDATFNVTLSAASTDPVTVDYATEDVTATGAFADADAPTTGFVQRDGAQLTLGGAPYRFSGLNVYNLNSDGLCAYEMSGAVLEDSLTAIAGSGRSVVRAWFFQDFATTGGVRDWTAFDRSLSALAAHGLRTIVTLGNQWADCDQGYGYKNDAWYATGYKTVDPLGTVSYRDWVAEVVTRYSASPAVLAFEPLNEPEVKPSIDAGCSPGAAATLRTFMADVTGLIRQLDSNHLISSGVIGGGQCGAQENDYRTLHELATIDLCSVHDYTAAVPMPGDAFNGMQVRLDQCAAIGKPLVVGEAGVKPNDVGGTLADRAAAIRAKLLRQVPAGVAGWLGWAWIKDGSTLDNYDIGPGDPMLAVLSGFGDYEHAAGALTFAPGQTTKTVTVKVRGDTLDELDETFLLKLANATGASVGDATGVGTIVDDDGPAALSVGDASVFEGDSGTTAATFDVVLTPASGRTVTVDFATAGASATSGVDFQAASGTLTFAPGQERKTVTVLVNGDETVEPNETFELLLSGQTNATIADGTGAGTILTDDVNAAPVVDIGPDAGLAEGALFTAAGSFTDPDANTWTATVDYGDGSGAQLLPLAADKTFQLSHVYADNGTFTITVAVNDGAATGADTALVTVTNVSPTVDAGPDAAIATGATFSSSGSFTDPGADTWTATVDYGDGSGAQTLTLAGNKTFALSHVYASEGTFTVTVTVTDDDGGIDSDTATVTVAAVVLPTLAIGDVQLGEGDQGEQTATFTVTRTGPTTAASSVDVATADGTATGTGAAGADADLDGFANGSDTCPGHYNADQTDHDGDGIGTRCDATPGGLIGPADQFILVYSRNGSAAPLAGGCVVFTQQNTGGSLPAANTCDAGPPLSLRSWQSWLVDTAQALWTDVLIQTPAGCGTGVTARVHNAAGTVIAVDPCSASGVGQPDYGSRSETLTFAAGATTSTFTVPVYGDVRVEPDETFSVALSNAVGATIADASATGAIQNDDAAPVVDAGAAAALNQGETLSRNGSFVDPDVGELWSATVDYGDGSGVQPLALAADKTFALSHLYAAAGLFTVTVQVRGSGGEIGTDSFAVTVAAPNTAPVVAAGADASVALGSAFTRAGSFTDPDDDTWTATVDYGDGSGVVPLALTGKTFTLDHLYASPGVYTVTVSVSDGEAGTGTDVLEVTVAAANHKPYAVDDFASAHGTGPAATEIDVLVNDTDIDGDELEIVTFNANGNDVTCGTSSCTFVPKANGKYSFTYTIGDGRGGTARATATVTVRTNENRAPWTTPPSRTASGRSGSTCSSTTSIGKATG